MSGPRVRRAAIADAVWPVAALYGALTAAAAALGAWLAAGTSELVRPWSLLDWVAEHALWGTLLGALLALVVRLGARLDPALRDPGRRRAASARLAAISVALGLVALTGALAGSRAGTWGRAWPALASAWLALGATWALLGRSLAGRSRFRALPRLDPARVAVLIALLTLPLAPGVRHGPQGEVGGGSSQASLVGRPPAAASAPESLLDAWRVMLGR